MLLGQYAEELIPVMGVRGLYKEYIFSSFIRHNGLEHAMH